MNLKLLRLFIFILVVASGLVVGQTPSTIPFPAHTGVQKIPKSSIDTIIRWNKNRKLSWADFKGKPPTNPPYDAASSVEVIWNVKRNNSGKVIFDVFAGFNTRSYTTTKSISCLEHEQLHFDLGEVYARMIIKYIDENKDKIPETPEGGEMMNHYFLSMREMMKSEGFRYDVETNHGLNKAKQAEWELYIENKLKELELYEF